MSDSFVRGVCSPEYAVALHTRGLGRVLSHRWCYVYPTASKLDTTAGWQLLALEEAGDMKGKDDLPCIPAYTVDELLLGIGTLKPHGVTVVFGVDTCMYAQIRVTRPDGNTCKYLEVRSSFIELLTLTLCCIADSGYLP